MKVEKTPLDGLMVVELDKFGDERGFFMERYSSAKFAEHGLPTNFVQDNHSRSSPGVLRGLHYQSQPAQGKLVGVTRGKILDVAVDIRPESKTLGQYFAIELSDMKANLLWIPPGFAHGFCVLGEEMADVLYKTTTLYNAEGEGGIAWNDPDIGVEWPIENATISGRDQNGQSFKEYLESPPKW